MNKFTSKKVLLFFGFLSISNYTLGQGGWVFDTNPLNDVTGYTTAIPYCGASFVEVNGDDHVDLFAAPKTLFINNGNGTFSLAASPGFSPQQSTSGSSSADLDNDGDNDLVIACVPSRVFLNDGTGSFTDSSSRVPDFSYYGSWAVAIGDYNEDRELDFIFAHASGYHPPSTPAPCKLYSGKAASFGPVPVTGYPFVTNLHSYTNPYWSDYDLDGDMDLFIASGPVTAPGLDPCYKNMKMETGKDTLISLSNELFATQAQDGQCYNFIDFDNDRDLDLCLTNWASAPTRMYRNDGGGNYISIGLPFTGTTTNLANCWGDYDNDGDLDVVITNGNLPTRYYRNNGNETFTYLPEGLKTPTATCGITNADYDNDGDLDIFTNGTGNNGNTSSVGLFINDTVAGNRGFVNLKLEGVASNRSAIGAVVSLCAGIKGNQVWQLREVNAQNTFQGQNDLRVHFGLGDATVIDSMIITWPSGHRDLLLNYPANTFYKVTEGGSVINLSVGEKGKAELFTLFPNPSEEVLNISFNGAALGSSPIFSIADVNGRVLQTGYINASKIIPVENLTPGVYFLHISGDKFISVQKFIKCQ